MPIRLNLLAEAQALEELRRRDPVKRAIWIGAGLVAVSLAWSASSQFKAVMIKAELSHLEDQLKARTNEYQQVVANQAKLDDINHRLGALRRLATNRILYGTLLNALQGPVVENVQLMRLRTDQSYTLNEEVKAKTNANSRIVPGKPASVTEKLVLTLDARDSAPNPGDQVKSFKQAISDAPYFQAALGKTNEVRLTSLSPPQPAPDSKPFVLFTLECRYPEKTQ
jgi:hypothetical protein